MRKLKLELDDLQVESFSTTPETSQSLGTVYGYQPWTDTCGATCDDTCISVCGVCSDGGGCDTQDQACHTAYCGTSPEQGCTDPCQVLSDDTMCHRCNTQAVPTDMCYSECLTWCPVC
jgi:hypothetical protein